MASDLVRPSVPGREGVPSVTPLRAGPGSGSDRGHGAPLVRSSSTRDDVASESKTVVGSQRADEATVDAKELEKAVEELNRALEAFSIGTRFEVDWQDDSLQVIVENRTTGDVIRKIPPDDVLRRRENLERLAGLLFDTNA